MGMSKVTKCEVNDCTYNADDLCHATAITIGNGRHPSCNAFWRFMMKGKGGDVGCTASVGACKVSSCIYNVGLECQAPEVFVGYKEREPNCLTFQMSCVADEGVYEVSSRKCNTELEFQAPEIYIG